MNWSYEDRAGTVSSSSLAFSSLRLTAKASLLIWFCSSARLWSLIRSCSRSYLLSPSMNKWLLTHIFYNLDETHFFFLLRPISTQNKHLKCHLMKCKILIQQFTFKCTKNDWIVDLSCMTHFFHFSSRIITSTSFANFFSIVPRFFGEEAFAAKRKRY